MTDDYHWQEVDELQERYYKNIAYFESLSDAEKFKLLWKEYVEKHSYDRRIE